MGIGSVIWNITEYGCYLCIIAYVLLNFGIITPKKAKKNSPALESMLTQGLNIAGKLAGVESNQKDKKKP